MVKNDILPTKKPSRCVARLLFRMGPPITPCGGHGVGGGLHGHLAPDGHLVVHVAYAQALPNPLV